MTGGIEELRKEVVVFVAAFAGGEEGTMIKTVEAGFKCLRKHTPNEYIIVEKKIDGGMYVKGSSPVTTWTTYCHGYNFHRERTFEEALNGLLTERQVKGGKL